jgi:rhomboid protease GluP
LYASTPRFWVTPTLIAINVVIFLAMLANSRALSPPPATVLAWGANFGPKTLHGEWWRLFAAMFLHFNLLHIGFNMWALANLGQLMERLVGNVGFLLLYLVSGLLGSVVSVAWDPEVMSAGASGAVFGVGGALLGFILLRRDSIPAPVLVPLRNSMFSFIGYNVVFGLMAPGIDNAAHLGGLAGGIGCGLLLSHPLTEQGVSKRWLRNAILLVVGAVVPAGVFQLLPEPPADLQAEVLRLSETEERLNAQYNDLVRRSRDKKLSNAEFAGEIENKLLPELTAAKTRFTSLRISPSRHKDADRIGKYLQLRVESWQSLVVGLRENNQAAMERYQQQSEAANLLAKPVSE